MRRQISIYISIPLLFLLACSNQEDILELQSLLRNPVHTQIFLKLKNSIDFEGTGFDNVVASEQIAPLRRNTQIYLKFLTKFEPECKATRKMHQDITQPLLDYDRDLVQMAERLKAYRELKRQVDSLATTENKAILAALDQQEQQLHRSLTNQFLIQRTAALFSQLNQQLEIIYQK